MRFIFLICILNIYIFASSKKETIAKAGDYVQIVIPASAWVSTLVIGDTQGEYGFYKSFFSTFATTNILKETIKEERPNGGDNRSFPSGHTSASFQGATFIHLRYGWKYAIIPYLGASFVGWSRVYTDHHYTHDVLAGAFIGSAFSWFFTKPYKIQGLEIKPVVFFSLNNKSNVYGLEFTW